MTVLLLFSSKWGHWPETVFLVIMATMMSVLIAPGSWFQYSMPGEVRADAISFAKFSGSVHAE